MFPRAPLFEVPARSYYLVGGPIEAAAESGTEFRRQTANVWWPDEGRSLEHRRLLRIRANTPPANPFQNANQHCPGLSVCRASTEVSGLATSSGSEPSSGG